MNEAKLIRWIDGVLLWEWDPIGVRDFHQCVDEYSGYVQEIAELVLAHAPPDVIAAHLDDIVTIRMLGRPKPDKSRRVAELLASQLDPDEE